MIIMIDTDDWLIKQVRAMRFSKFYYANVQLKIYCISTNTHKHTYMYPFELEQWPNKNPQNLYDPANTWSTQLFICMGSVFLCEAMLHLTQLNN